MKIILMLALSALCSIHTGVSQETKRPVLWSAYLSLGYAHAAPSVVREQYDQILDSYRSAGVPISTQTQFGSALGASGGFRFSRLENISVGLSAAYWYAPAYSGYQDEAGTLKVNGSARAFELSLVIKARLASLGAFPVNVCAEPGVAVSSFQITEELRFHQFPGANYDARWSASAWGPCAQATIGTSVEYGSFMFSLDGGYKFAWSIVSEVTVRTTSGDKKKYEPWDIGEDGFVLSVTIEKRL